MTCRMVSACALVLLGFFATPVQAQTSDMADTARIAPVVPSLATRPATGAESPVQQFYLDGPRVGVTFLKDGSARTQFGWHSENQATPGSRGPWFLVERVILIGGVERSEFIPTGTVVFGVRTPSSFEFGIGPSLTISAQGASTAVVLAAGQTLYYGGVRVPINVALAVSQRDGQSAVRVTLISGWAIKQKECERRESRPYKFGLER